MLRQARSLDIADIAIPLRLAEGPAVSLVQHLESFAEQQLVKLLSATRGRPMQACSGHPRL
jgi:hypothetical protein